ncbi:hypothetical protein, partial [Pseudomonas viridiflava]|uniref:hypothetical protein n=1 Tax=Pseudomonas viridiflava TaxID=33069 RepID=UPI00197F79A5
LDEQLLGVDCTLRGSENDVQRPVLRAFFREIGVSIATNASVCSNALVIEMELELSARNSQCRMRK